MSEHEQPIQQPLLSENALGIITGIGLVIAITGLLLSGLGTIDDTDLVTSFLLVGLAIAILGVVFWMLWHQPWEHFDDLQTALYRGEHEPEPEPALEPAALTAPVAVSGSQYGAVSPVEASMGDPTEPDNLTLIEGIGPKTAEALHAAGIVTFAQLAQRSPDELEALVKDQGVRIVGSTQSWPEQARLAASGGASALKDLQERVGTAGAVSDDLTVIDGIGPKTAEALNAGGVRTFQAVAARSPEELENLVTNQGVRLVAPTDTWPEQARLAAAGDLSALKALQARIVSGVLQAGDTGTEPALPEPPADEVPAQIEAPQAAALPAPEPDAVPAAPAAPVEPDVLTKIEGVGPKIQQILRENGFPTYQAIANADADAIRAVLENAGSRYRLADPATWPAQAAFLARGDVDGLRAFQAQLKGGRRTDE